MNTKHRILFILIGGGNVYTGEGSAGIGSTQDLKLNVKYIDDHFIFLP